MSGVGHPRTLAGRYRLENVIGRGGMSTVYRAKDLALDRVVAVKVALDPLAEENPVYVARFKREARAAAALSHTGVVTIYDAGADGSTRYIVMECVNGRSLADVLRDEGTLEPARATRIAEQVADTLAAAHAAGIVHRDIKPGNIMVGAEDRVKVLDFGIARTADAVTLTQTASILGTAPYMSPEQAMGNPADARSDIYSLGCVLYEMLTGKPPFMAEVPAAVLHQHVRVAPKDLSEHKPAIPAALDALVLNMLAKAPADRPQTAAEVRDRLGGVNTDIPTAPTSPLPPAAEAVAGGAAIAAGASAASASEAQAVPTEAPRALPEATPATPAPPATAGPPRGIAGPPPATAGPPPEAAAPPPGTAAPPPGTAATRAMPPGRPSRSPRRGLWAALAALAIVLLGAAVALALSGAASSTSSSTASHPGVTATVTATSGGSTRSTSPPSTSASSTPNSTSSTAATTTTTVTTTTTTTPTTATAPPGQGGTPPGQAKKKDKSK